MRNWDLLAFFMALLAWGVLDVGAIGMIMGWSAMEDFFQVSPSKLYHVSWYLLLGTLAYFGWRLLGSPFGRSKP